MINLAFCAVTKTSLVCRGVEMCSKKNTNATLQELALFSLL